jgi:hypothetical protein
MQHRREAVAELRGRSAFLLAALAVPFASLRETRLQEN